MHRNSVIVSTKQERIAALAKQSPEMAFTSLAYLMDIDWLKEAYRRTRKDGAAGVDGVTAEEYEQDFGRTLFAPRRIPGRRYRVTNSRPWRRTRPPGSETSECIRGTAKRRKRSAAGWAVGSRSTLIVLMKPGNWSHGTRWREGKTERGCLMLDPGPGNTSEASNLESRITVTTQDSNPGTQRLVVWRIHHQRNRMR